MSHRDTAYHLQDLEILDRLNSVVTNGPTVMDFGEWLESTKRLQAETYGFVPAEFTDDELVTYLKNNVLAAFVETGEFIQTINWKPWGRHDGSFKKTRQDSVEEIVDILHFWANVMIAFDVTPAELSAAYRSKQQINKERQDEGYQG